MTQYWNPPQPDLFAAMQAAQLADDFSLLQQDIKFAALSEDETHRAQCWGQQWLDKLRAQQQDPTAIEALMQQYNLSHKEGVLMMCLAEAVLRIPDTKTIDLLLSDKLSAAEWQSYLGKSKVRSVNAATLGLLLGRRLMRQADDDAYQTTHYAQHMLRKISAPVVRRVVVGIIQRLAQQFIMGRDIAEAVAQGCVLTKDAHNISFSFDMLGEAARTEHAAQQYFDLYLQAIKNLAASKLHPGQAGLKPSVSVKLSAMYPRYEFAQRDLAVPCLQQRLLTLAQVARDGDIELTVDAEECARLELSLEIIYYVLSDSSLKDWNGLGLAVQSYQKRSLALLKWLVAVAEQLQKKIPVRLTKGAYWDYEIKLAQEEGLSHYPVFTRKAVVDAVYLAAARYMLQHQESIKPQFATHNVYTAAAVLAMADDESHLEFQRLYGMGHALHDALVATRPGKIVTRVYAPVGPHYELLPYLVRRMLENGANNSFVQQVLASEISDKVLLEHPLEVLQRDGQWQHASLALPRDIFQPERQNAPGVDLNCMQVMQQIDSYWNDCSKKYFSYVQMQKKYALTKVTWGEKSESFNPALPQHAVGCVLPIAADKLQQLEDWMQYLSEGYVHWSKRPVAERSAILRCLADLITEHQYELMYLINQEAGRVYADALSEVREAIDFCRYYAVMAEKHLQPQPLSAVSGESNQLLMRGRGVIACISPWNFPLAIFAGQVVAALVAGNSVLAKPSSLTPLCAARLVELAYIAGVPKDVLQLAVCSGKGFSRYVLPHPKLAGVMLTGSNATADTINQTLAKRPGTSPAFIAETGGINVMLADSSTFVEQLVDDVLVSAFGSAGQRCSSLRVLCLQEEIADRVTDMLLAALKLRKVGDPKNINTDIGPLISESARKQALAYIKQMSRRAQQALQHTKLLYPNKAVSLPAEGYFIAPHVFLIDDLQQITEEIFAPVLHIYRYPAKQLDQVLEQVNQWGYGLTCGIHSRIDTQVEYISEKLAVGNVYVNRNMIGAVVGCQPFGGRGLSGTGPKAGGPHYLTRLCHEQTRCINTAAVGGDPDLLNLADH